ncbi:MAG TPA: cupredoxin domain-containing protein [Gaiellaceae bacterium]|nr:cupredoxin domain-containing protein [Gaiellaceae bacterium]
MYFSPRTLLLVAAAATLAAATTLLSAKAASAPARVQVVEKEYTLTLSRLRIPSGAAIVQVLNFGMDGHDLVISPRAKGAKPVRFSRLSPGGRATLTVRLAPGRYTLWCSLPGHRARGMVAPLVVTR